MKVRATKLFKELKVRPKELDHIPEDNEEFECSKERYLFFTEHTMGHFVYDVVEQAKVEAPEKAVVKKTTKKKSA